MDEDHKQSLYEMHNDSIVTISSIKEFDKEKDWLSKQLGGDSSSESDTEQAIHTLIENMKN